MCGGAIISDLKPAGTRRLTADGGKKKGWKHEVVKIDDDFEADFEEFEDESEEEEQIDVEPFAFASNVPFSRGKLSDDFLKKIDFFFPPSNGKFSPPGFVILDFFYYFFFFPPWLLFRVSGNWFCFWMFISAEGWDVFYYFFFLSWIHAKIEQADL